MFRPGACPGALVAHNDEARKRKNGKMALCMRSTSCREATQCMRGDWRELQWTYVRSHDIVGVR